MPFSFTIPIFVFLVIYIAFLLFYFAYGCLSIIQLIQLGVPGPAMTISLTTFAAIVLTITIGSIFLLSSYDWSVMIQISDLFNSEVSTFFQGL